MRSIDYTLDQMEACRAVQLAAPTWTNMSLAAHLTRAGIAPFVLPVALSLVSICVSVSNDGWKPDLAISLADSNSSFLTVRDLRSDINLGYLVRFDFPFGNSSWDTKKIASVWLCKIMKTSPILMSKDILVPCTCANLRYDMPLAKHPCTSDMLQTHELVSICTCV